MFRRSAVLIALLVLVRLSLAEAVPDADTKAPASPQAVQARLAKIVNTPAIEKSTTMRQALKVFQDRLDVEVIVDARAFRNIQGQDPREQVVELPALTGVSARTALGRLAEQVGGAIVQEGNVVWLAPAAYKHRSLNQLIDVDFKDKDLAAALEDLSARSGINIVLDRKRAGDAAKQTITLKLTSTALDKAVLLVADLAGLEMVAVEDVLYVTTTQNATKLRGQLPPDRYYPASPICNPPPPIGIPPGPANAVPMLVPAPDGTIN